jgi:hypothetical protein
VSSSFGEFQELIWYELCLSLVTAIETQLEMKAANQSSHMAGVVGVVSTPILDLPAILALNIKPCMQKNLDVRMQIVKEHKRAIGSIVKMAKGIADGGLDSDSLGEGTKNIGPATQPSAVGARLRRV